MVRTSCATAGSLRPTTRSTSPGGNPALSPPTLPPDTPLPRRAPPTLLSRARQSISSSSPLHTRKGRVPRDWYGAARGVLGTPRQAGAITPTPSRSRPRQRVASTSGTDGSPALPRPTAVGGRRRDVLKSRIRTGRRAGTSSALRLARRRDDGGRRTDVVAGRHRSSTSF